MSGKRHRVKGNRIEREIVDWHKELGIRAERYPLSGASHFRGLGHDIDLYVLKGAPLKGEVKARNKGQGWTLLEKWIDGADVLFLRADNARPLVVVTPDAYERLLRAAKEEQ